ncbi:reverse transcriptase domain-containing protein [Tanacetum coccineum]|uniref:Reverse transcriptase domain-containing protein n=1 Tax=Tanacetum coccineum TaxID=301880 RepID=A0ABQ5EKH0_9ASTR
MKAITTRSGVAYEGPSIPTNHSPKKVVEREIEVTTDKEQTNFQGSTAQISPPVIPISILELDVLKTLPKTIPESNIPKSLPKPNIPYPSRHDDQKSHDKASNQIEKIFQIFQDLRFDISFADALLLMPRFAPTIKSLLMNKEKLLELAKIPNGCMPRLGQSWRVVYRNFVKLVGPSCRAQAHLFYEPAQLKAHKNSPLLYLFKALSKCGEGVASHFFFCEQLSLPELTPTRMTLELADRSITYPKGLAEDVFIKIGKFHFPTDFVVVDFEADPRVPLILRRSFLRTGRALIDVYGEEITLRVDNEAVTFNLDQTTRYSSTNDKSVNRIDIIDAVCEEYAPEMLGFSIFSGGNPTPTSEPFTSEFILEEIEAYLKDYSISPEIDYADCNPEEDICLIEKLKLNEATRKDHFPLPFMDQMIERLAGNEFYCFLDGFSGYFQIPIDPQDQEKTTFTCPYGTFAPWKCLWMISRFLGDSFDSCLSNLEKMLKLCEDTNLVLNWEKCHFMCKEEIVLGHKISKAGIEVDRAKVDVIAKLPHPTTVKGVRSFLGHAGFYRRFIQDFSKIARPMTHLLEKETPFVFSKDCIDAFQTLKKKLTEAPILVVPDWNLPFELMCDASDFAIGAVLGQRKMSIRRRRVQNQRSKRIFNVVIEFFSFNSRLKDFSRKLKTRWSGLFTIPSFSDMETVELSQPEVQTLRWNGHRVKITFGGDFAPKEVQVITLSLRTMNSGMSQAM